MGSNRSTKKWVTRLWTKALDSWAYAVSCICYYMWITIYFSYLQKKLYWKQINTIVLCIANNNVLYCSVLYWWGGHCCPMHCDRFEIYCAPPNLGITRTWIRRLNFAHIKFFQAWGSLTSLKSQTQDSRLEVSPKGFLRPEKIHRPQQGLNLQTLDFEAIILPRHNGII